MLARIVAVTAVAGLVCGLAGCGSGPAGGGHEGGAQPLTGTGPITYAITKDSTGTYQPLIDRWNRAHPGERVTINELPTEPDAAREQLVQNAEIKSDAYGVLALDNTWATEFAAKRYVVEIPRSQFDPKPFLPSTVQSGSYRGRLYAAPVIAGAGFLYYRTDLLRKAGIARPPTTWAQLKADCARIAKLPAARHVHCYAGQHDKYEGLTVNFTEAVLGAGGQVIGADGRPHVNTPQAREGLEFLVNGFRSGEIPKVALTYQEETGRAAYQKGQFVFLRNWPYLWEPMNATDGSSTVAGKFDVAPLPGRDGLGTSMLGGTDLAISSYTENKLTALRFIRYMTSTRSQTFSATKGALPPTRSALYANPGLKKRLPYLGQLHVALLRAKPRPQVINYADVSSVISDNAYKAEDGSLTVDQALAAMQKGLTTAVQQRP